MKSNCYFTNQAKSLLKLTFLDQSLFWESATPSHVHQMSQTLTSQSLYEGDVFLGAQFRSPSWTRFPNHLLLMIILHFIILLIYTAIIAPPPQKKKIIIINVKFHVHALTN